MSLQVIDGDDRYAHSVSEALCAGDADEQRADQSRPARYRNRIDVIERCLRIVERAMNERKKMLQMFARRDFRDHAAERLMTLDLRCDVIDAHRSIALDKRHRRFVARRFDSENEIRHEQWGTRGKTNQLSRAEKLLDQRSYSVASSSGGQAPSPVLVATEQRAARRRTPDRRGACPPLEIAAQPLMPHASRLTPHASRLMPHTSYLIPHAS